MIRRQDGMTIVEVLVAITVLVAGILAAFSALDSSRKLTLVSERQTEMAHVAESELERVESLPYSQVALTGTSTNWSTTSGDPTYVSNPVGSCPTLPTGSAPTYQPDHSSGGSTVTEPLVINGCSYTNTVNGTSTTTNVTSGNVQPSTTWSNGPLSGQVFDFITFTNDPICSQTATPGSNCPTTYDYKRVTVLVTLNGAAQPSHPAIVQGYVKPPNSGNNPVGSSKTSCVNSAGQTISCSNTVTQTPVSYQLHDCSYNGTCNPPSCSGNPLHDTLVAVGTVAPAPDLMSASLPSGNCTSSTAPNPPTPPCYETDLGCGGSGTTPPCGSGCGIELPSTGTGCGSGPPLDNSKSHSWVTEQVPLNQSINLSGPASMTSYLVAPGGTSVNATVCLELYLVPSSVLGSLTGNLLATPISSVISEGVTANGAFPSPVSFNFNIPPSTVGAQNSIELVMWMGASGGPVDIVYDQADFASQLTLLTQ